jgi:hypothetical protein
MGHTSFWTVLMLIYCAKTSVKKRQALSGGTKKAGLEVNAEKSMYKPMLMTRHQTAAQNHDKIVLKCDVSYTYVNMSCNDEWPCIHRQ